MREPGAHEFSLERELRHPVWTATDAFAENLASGAALKAAEDRGRAKSSENVDSVPKVKSPTAPTAEEVTAPKEESNKAEQETKEKPDPPAQTPATPSEVEKSLHREDDAPRDKPSDLPVLTDRAEPSAEDDGKKDAEDKGRIEKETDTTTHAVGALAVGVKSEPRTEEITTDTALPEVDNKTKGSSEAIESRVDHWADNAESPRARASFEGEGAIGTLATGHAEAVQTGEDPHIAQEVARQDGGMEGKAQEVPVAPMEERAGTMLTQMREFFREHPRAETFAGTKMRDLTESLAPTLRDVGDPETQARFVSLWHTFTKQSPELRADLDLARQVYTQYNHDVEQLREAGFERNPQSLAKFNSPMQLVEAMAEFGDAPMAKLLGTGRPSDPVGVARDYYEQYPLHPARYPGDEAAAWRKENAEPPPSVAERETELRKTYGGEPGVEEHIIKRYAGDAKPRVPLERYIARFKTLMEHFGDDPDFTESTMSALALRDGGGDMVKEGAAWKQRYQAIQAAALESVKGTPGERFPRLEALRLAVAGHKGRIADRLGYARYLDKLWSKITMSTRDMNYESTLGHKAGRNEMMGNKGINGGGATPEEVVIRNDERRRQVGIAKDLIAGLKPIERQALLAHHGFFTETRPEELASRVGEDLGAYVNRVVIPKLRAEAAKYEQDEEKEER